MVAYPGVDVVVVNYQTPDDLDAFLESFERCHSEVQYCTLVIVNVEARPEDEEVAALWRRRLGIDVDVLTHAFPDNVGYARACNYGAGLGMREVAAFFNADTALEPGVLKRCHEVLTDPAHPERAIAGPKQVDSTGRITAAGVRGTDVHPRLDGWRRADSPQLFGSLDDAVLSVAGSAYFIRRDVWNELAECPQFREAAPDATGAFLPTQHYYEETWCSYHARAHGYRCVYVGDARMRHEWHKASPVGGWVDKQSGQAREMFRAACDLHGIARD